MGHVRRGSETGRGEEKRELEVKGTAGEQFQKATGVSTVTKESIDQGSPCNGVVDGAVVPKRWKGAERSTRGGEKDPKSKRPACVDLLIDHKAGPFLRSLEKT